MPAGHTSPTQDSIPTPREELSAHFREENLIRRVWLFLGAARFATTQVVGMVSKRAGNCGKQEEGEVEWGATILPQHPTPRLAHTCTRGRCRSAVLLPRETWEGGRARQRQQAHLSSGLDRSRFEILLTLHFQI